MRLPLVLEGNKEWKDGCAWMRGEGCESGGHTGNEEGLGVEDKAGVRDVFRILRIWGWVMEDEVGLVGILRPWPGRWESLASGGPSVRQQWCCKDGARRMAVDPRNKCRTIFVECITRQSWFEVSNRLILVWHYYGLYLNDEKCAYTTCEILPTFLLYSL